MSLMEIGFELTNDCNLDCLHCIREKKDTGVFLPVDIIIRVLKEARIYGFQKVGFTGGEPTIHPDFLGIIDAVTSLGYPYYFVSNGLNCPAVFPRIMGGKEERRKRLLLGVSLSLDGAREETHDAVRGRGSFKRVIQAAVYLREKRVPLTLQMVVNFVNKGEVEEVARLAHNLGAGRLYYAPIFPTPQNIGRGLVPAPGEWKGLAEQIRGMRDRMRLEIKQSIGWYEDLPFLQCSFLRMESINIDYLGRMTFCCQISGYRGADGARGDVIADLRKTGLYRGLQALRKKIARFNREKLDHIGKGRMSDLDHFPCFYCSRRFGKLDWLRTRYPKNPWSAGLNNRKR